LRNKKNPNIAEIRPIIKTGINEMSDRDGIRIIGATTANAVHLSAADMVGRKGKDHTGREQQAPERQPYQAENGADTKVAATNDQDTIVLHDPQETATADPVPIEVRLAEIARSAKRTVKTDPNKEAI
jgi:hypothetical protein